MTTHLHITAWALGLILFIVALILAKKGNAKGSKIVQMILRLDYLLILFSGGQLFAAYDSINGELIVKLIAGILVISALEMILVRGNKNKSTGLFWGLLVISLVITLILGFMRLPFTV